MLPSSFGAKSKELDEQALLWESALEQMFKGDDGPSNNGIFLGGHKLYIRLQEIQWGQFEGSFPSQETLVQSV